MVLQVLPSVPRVQSGTISIRKVRTQMMIKIPIWLGINMSNCKREFIQFKNGSSVGILHFQNTLLPKKSTSAANQCTSE